MRKLAAIGLAAMLAACTTTTTELPLADNLWRIETEGRGYIGMADTDNATVQRAAELTLQQGYERFLLHDPQSSTGRQFLGMTPTTANSTVVGNSVYTNVSGGMPMVQQTRTTSVIVQMLNAGEQGYENALDARSIVLSAGS